MCLFICCGRSGMEGNQDTCFNQTVSGEILGTDLIDDGDSGLESIQDLEDPLLSRRYHFAVCDI